MFKKVLLAGALLAPVLAYGGNPGTDLSVQIVPAASPAPLPPTTSLTPPAPAQAAGFTTLAFNMDFTGASTSELNGSTFDAQNLSSWLDCAGASSPIWQQAGPGITTDCEFSVVNDSGTSALDIHYGQSNYSNGAYQTQMATCNAPATVCSAATFPLGKYIEFTVRDTAATAGLYGSGGILGDVWSWYTAATGGQEWDFLEIYPNIPSGGQSFCCNNPPPYASNPAFFTSYHKFGLLVTSNGNGNEAACEYLDGVAINGGGTTACAGTTGVGSSDNTSRNFLIMTQGPQGTGHGAPGADMDLLVQSVRVWECPGWASGQCNGSIINSAP